jgi:23S rRNA (guanosine2251-2'-O)-methyltransferase
MYSFTVGELPLVFKNVQRMRLTRYSTASRFFIKKVPGKIDQTTLASVLTKSGINSINSGVIIYPGRQEVVPIQNGQLQLQYRSTIDLVSGGGDSGDGPESCVMVGFHGHSSSDEEVWDQIYHPVDMRVMAKMNKMLAERYPYIAVADLDNDYSPLAGTPPSRVYRHFIRKVKMPPTPAEGGEEGAEKYVDVLVERACVQIDLTYRQLEADRSSYLRNTDIQKSYRPEHFASIGSTSQGVGGDSATALPTLRYEIHPIVLVLDNLRSAYNVGSIYRTAETASVNHVVTCGITPTPPHPRVLKTALTSCETIPTKHYHNVLEAVADLKAQGYAIVSLETTSKSILYTEADFARFKPVPGSTRGSGGIALVVGHEKTGVCEALMDASDVIVEIPTYGRKNSLNVTTALSVVLFELLRQWKS